MSAMRTPTLFAFIVLCTVWVTWFRPTSLGGSATYLIVSGESMEPAYHDGDFVLLRDTGAYGVGDVIAYPMENQFGDAGLVIHRVVGEDADGFITRGDNRGRDDPWRATGTNIVGESWIHIPGAGHYLAWIGQPNHFAAIVAVIFLAGGLGATTHTRRKRGRRMRRQVPESGSAANGSGSLGSLQPMLSYIGIGAAVIVGGLALLAFIAFRAETRTATESADSTHTETGNYEYAISMTPSTLYPDGVLHSPSEPAGAPADGSEPPAPPSAFTSLTTEVAVDFEYVLESPEPVEMQGMLSADLVISPTGGEWQRSEPLLAPTPFEGTTTSERIRIDTIAVGALIDQIEAETGLSGGDYDLTLRMNVAGTGTRAGEPFNTEFQSDFVLGYDETLITPPATLSTVDTNPSTTTELTANTLALGVWEPRVSVARSIAIVGLVVALGAIVVGGAQVGWALRDDEDARIRARYGSRIVDVHGADETRASDAINVASMKDLARIAERCGAVILHEPVADGHRYLVRDGDDTYVYLAQGRPASGTETPDLSGTGAS